MLYKQEYECENCGVESHVLFNFDDPVHVVVRKLGEDHHKWSPGCASGVRDFKLFDCSSAEVK